MSESMSIEVAAAYVDCIMHDDEAVGLRTFADGIHMFHIFERVGLFFNVENETIEVVDENKDILFVFDNDNINPLWLLDAVLLAHAYKELRENHPDEFEAGSRVFAEAWELSGMIADLDEEYAN